MSTHDQCSVSIYSGDLLSSRMSLGVLRQTQATFTPPDRSPSCPSYLDDRHCMDIIEEAWFRSANGYDDTGIQTGDVEPVFCDESVESNTCDTKTSPTYPRIELYYQLLTLGSWAWFRNSKWSQRLYGRMKRGGSTISVIHTRPKLCTSKSFDKPGGAMEKEWKQEKDRVMTLQPQQKPAVRGGR
jgi:hypothetical protein